MLFRPLLPASVLYAEIEPSDVTLNVLYAAEFEQIKLSVEKRQREYTAGRVLARSLFNRAGIPAFALLNGKDRAPRWPNGIVGSITHCNSLCAVAIGKTTDIVAIGIDVEPAAPLPKEAESLAVLPEEYLSIKNLPESIHALATRLIFSAKEATYKAIYPRTQLFLEFSEIHIELQEAGSFIATVLNPNAVDLYQTKIVGQYTIDSQHLGTSVVLV